MPYRRPTVFVLCAPSFTEELARQLLVANGMEVRTFAEVAAAERAAALTSPAAIVLDAEWLPRLPRGGHCVEQPLVVLAAADQAEGANPHAIGAEGSVVSKPLDTFAFARAVSRLVRRRTTSVAREAPV